MGGELDAGAGSDPSHQLVDGRIGHRGSPPATPEVYEHVVRVELAVFDVHVLAVEPHERGRHRHHRRHPHLGPGPVGVVVARNDVHFPASADEVTVT